MTLSTGHSSPSGSLRDMSRWGSALAEPNKKSEGEEVTGIARGSAPRQKRRVEKRIQWIWRGDCPSGVSLTPLLFLFLCIQICHFVLCFLLVSSRFCSFISPFLPSLGLIFSPFIPPLPYQFYTFLFFQWLPQRLSICPYIYMNSHLRQ